MKNAPIIKKDSINLSEQNIWRTLEAYGMEISSKENDPLTDLKARKITRLLDQAFELLLDKLIRQN